MRKFLDKFSYQKLILFSILLGGAPFITKPHMIEKLQMLSSGTLHKPVDIFDLLMHSCPVILLIIKAAFSFRTKDSLM